MQKWLTLLLCLLLGVSGYAQKKPAPGQIPDKAVHETYIHGQKRVAADSLVALRITVMAAVNFTESLPVPNASVLVMLDHKGWQTMYQGKTGADGNAEAKFELPNLPEGEYRLRILTSSNYGSDKIEDTLQVERREKILLVTDKPIYQPSQTIHLRALALKQMTLRPMAGCAMLFEVEDSKNNKVFKQQVQSDEYGIGHATFVLAEEVNTGAYRISCTMDKNKADKNVTVEKYVLPKFKVTVTGDKQYLMPGETLKGTVQGDYFFGKPVAGGKVKLSASTFDVAFKEFSVIEGTTSEEGSFAFELKVPDYLVGQPLEQGDALIKVAIELTDKAMHTEKKTKTFPVASQPIRLAVVAEGGKLIPELVNQLYVIASYPDGRPATGKVRLEVVSATPDANPTAADGRTDATGIATLLLLPKREELQAKAGSTILPISVQMSDYQGRSAQLRTELHSLPINNTILLRPNQAIYNGGEQMVFEMLSTFDTGTVYLDLIKDGQTVLTSMAELKDGRGQVKIEASGDLFGSLVCHAYKLLPDGNFVRATRRIYVQPPSQIQIVVAPNQSVYRPGDNAEIRFTTTDQQGKPLAAALGLIIVDEAVYALQELQPGLEKVYFTLEKELSDPKYQIKYGPADSLPELVRAETIAATRQKAATILFSQCELLDKHTWERNPRVERKANFQSQCVAILQALLVYIQQHDISHKHVAGHWGYQPGLIATLVATKRLEKKIAQGPFGEPITMEALAQLDPVFAYNVMGRLETARKIGRAHEKLYELWRDKQPYGKNPLDTLVIRRKLATEEIVDAWGRILHYQKDPNNPYYYTWELRHNCIVSAGPDGKFNTNDDVHTLYPQHEINLLYNQGELPLLAQAYASGILLGGNRRNGRGHDWMVEEEGDHKMREDAPPMPTTATRPTTGMDKSGLDPQTTAAPNNSTAVAPPRIREYFPETLLFEPRLITDKNGKASLNLEMADSITTWRLTATANSKNGLLGGTTSALRVFQDFFVDIDFPVALTQNDEVSVPVAIFNYLPKEQTVRLVVEKAAWFELLDAAEKQVTMSSKEVGVVYFRVKAKQIGYHRLTVLAYGSQMSDAVKRQVEIVPDGKRIETVINGRLAQSVTHEITIPERSIAGASKIILKCYPGMGAILVEGLEGMLRMPGG